MSASRVHGGRGGAGVRGRRARAAAAVAACAAVLAAACDDGAAVVEVRLAPEERRPHVSERVALPEGAVAAAVWAAPDGGGVIALRDGRLFALDSRGSLAPLERVPGEQALPEEGAVAGFGSRGAGAAIAFDARGARLVEHGLTRRLALPAALGTPRAFTRFGAEALWASDQGLFATDGGRWLRLDDAAGLVGDAAEVVGFAPAAGRREAWVRRGDAVRRVRLAPGAGAPPAWSELVAGVELGRVRAVAALDGARGVVASDRGVTVVAPDRVRIVTGGEERGAPAAVAGGGGWAWVAWGGALMRTDGERWESLARDAALGEGARISVDEATGVAALVLDARGGVLRVEAEEALRLSGLAHDAFVFDTAVELEALPPRPAELARVAFTLDGRPLCPPAGGAPPACGARTQPPWGWGAEGARRHDLAGLGFGTHVVEATAHYRDGRELRRAVRFDYVSPVGRAPSYERDVRPLFEARCGRCHGSGSVARDLSDYERLRAQAPAVRASLRERRMPPDVLLDAASLALVTAWIDASMPP